jgi:uncharacterized delta-60 repeat protein
MPLFAQVQQAWVSRYTGPTNSTAAAVAMGVDNSSNVYVAGSLSWTNGASDYLIVKYDPNGTQLWAQSYDGPSNAVDVAKALAIDGAGDVYVTGASGNTIATVKYDPNGNQLWVARYNSSTNDGARPAAITVDDTEAVYVAGTITNGFKVDYLTIKYDASGNEIWSARYHGPNTGIIDLPLVDAPTAIAVDHAGNVCVTGRSVSSWAFDFDGDPYPALTAFATVKYDTNGTLLWAARWRGWDRSSDSANAITVDKDNNVYVTGGARDCDYDRFYRLICLSHYATLKYDSAGNQLWEARYDGPAKEGDAAIAIAIDSLGKVIVTGWSDVSVNGDVGEDCVTIKYDEQGNQLWLARYSDPAHGNKPSAITVDRQGNIYIAASSYSGTNTLDDFAIVKYDGNGNQLWVARYDGPDHGEDVPVGFALDQSGNIYVSGSKPFWTGTSNPFTTVKFVQTDLSGLPIIVTGPRSQSATEGDSVSFSIAATGAEPLSYQWRLDGFDIPGATNATLTLPYLQRSQAGDYSVVVTNTIGLTVSATARLIISPRLQLSWLATYGAELDPYDAANAIAIDDAGNLFVTGYVVTDNNGNADYATVKYDTWGNQLWAARYNGPANANDAAVAVATDKSGNAYVTGYSQGVGTGDDYATLKYDPQGNQLWVARYNGPGNTGGRPAYHAIKVDDTANAYVTGTAGTVKYDRDGNQLWVRTNVPGEALAVDASGNVYVTGTFYPSTTNSDISTVKYDADGNQLWIAYYDGPAHSYDTPGRARALPLDPFGNVYVTGTSSVNYTNEDFVTMKYDVNGKQLWAARYDGPTHGWDEARAICVDTNLNVYVTGVLDEAGDVAGDLATIKYAPDGQQLWVARYDGPAHEADGPWAMMLDGKGNIFVAGYVTVFDDPIGTSYDFITLEYDSAGHQLAADRLGDPNDAVAYDMALDRDGNLYVAGYSFGDGFLIAKYMQHPIATEWISATMLTPEVFQFTLRGEALRSYDVQASTDLTHWTTVTTLFNWSGTVPFSDTIATNQVGRFYRAVKVP